MSYRKVLIIIFLAGYGSLTAASTTAPDFMRSVGKIYVVAAVCLVILLALFLYVIQLDRKISRLEKRQNNE